MGFAIWDWGLGIEDLVNPQSPSFFFKKNNNNELTKLLALEPIQVIFGIRQFVVHFIYLTKANLQMNKMNHKLVHSIIHFLLNHQKKNGCKKTKCHFCSLIYFQVS